MPRITPEERFRMHSYLDFCIDKMNSPKNANKNHWSEESIQELHKRVQIEVNELDLAILRSRSEEVLDECRDVINTTMMIMDNVLEK